MESLISTYGYAAVLLGTFLEGETILVLAGFAAHRGYLELPWVIVAAFFGTLIGDQLYFYLGRLKGIDWLERRPTWKSKASRAFVLVEKHETLIILTFRFLYGLRTVTPFVIGLSGVRAVKYFFLNIIGAALWAVSIGVLGYLFGHTLELVLGDIKHMEMEILAAIGVIGVVLWAVYWLKSRRRAREEEESRATVPTKGQS